MVEGLLRISNADICVSVTGYTSGDKKDENDGIFYFGIKHKETEFVHLEKQCFLGTREEIRYQQTTYILWQVNNMLNKLKKQLKINKIK